MKIKAIGIICEFNPFHNGHQYFINSIKEKYPEHVIILVLNGYFLQRGEISVMSKEDKTKIALSYGVDIILEHPVFFGTQSADKFAKSAIEILNKFKIEKLIFGSECNDTELLTKLALNQLKNPEFDSKVKSYLKEGLNYPTAIAKACTIDNFEFTPNDILGISYIKAIMNVNEDIAYETIQRTNDFHDNESNNKIVSASNIRTKLSKGIDINNFVPEGVANNIISIQKQKLFELIKSKIITDNNLYNYIDVDSGIHNRLNKFIKTSKSLDEYIENIKPKRLTYNRINRMLVHILLGMTKEDNRKTKIEYIKVLGFNSKGQEYIKKIKRHLNTSHIPKKDTRLYEYEQRSALIFELITGINTYDFENNNKPITLEEL